MRKWSLLLLIVGCSSTALSAQFGGRQGDVVIYVVSAKGQPDFQTVPNSTVNTQTGFEIVNPNDVPLEPFGPDFPSESRRRMHAEEGDVFNAIIHELGEESPHQELLETVKVFLADGLLRLKPINAPPTDSPIGLFVRFPRSVDFGPNEALFKGLYLMWTPAPFFPATRKADPEYRSPIVPSGFSSGNDYLLTLATFAGIVPWVGLDRQYPNSGWQQGIDSKLIDLDSTYGTKIQILRLRPGRQTPLFRINANTHLWVLSGRVTLTPAGGLPVAMQQNIYAFVPPGFAIRLSNPAVFR